MGDDLDPAAEPALTTTAIDAFPRAHEGGLGDFVGFAQIAEAAGTATPHGAVVALEQFAERVTIARLCGTDESGVAVDVSN